MSQRPQTRSIAVPLELIGYEQITYPKRKRKVKNLDSIHHVSRRESFKNSQLSVNLQSESDKSSLVDVCSEFPIVLERNMDQHAVVRPFTFDGQRFGDWTQCVENYLIANDLYEVLLDEKSAEKYRDADKTVRFTDKDLKEYGRKNAKTKSVFMGCVSSNILARISNDITAYHMWEHMHSLYRVKSAVGENVSRRQLYNLRFIIGHDIDKYIEKFEAIVLAIRQNGGTCDEREEINAFKMSLPDEFTGTIEWFEGLPTDERTLQALKMKAAERNRRYLESGNDSYARTDFAGAAQFNQRGNKRFQKDRYSNTGNRNNNNNFSNKRSDFLKAKCFNCGGMGHISFFCPSSKGNAGENDRNNSGFRGNSRGSGPKNFNRGGNRGKNNQAPSSSNQTPPNLHSNNGNVNNGVNSNNNNGGNSSRQNTSSWRSNIRFNNNANANVAEAQQNDRTEILPSSNVSAHAMVARMVSLPVDVEGLDKSSQSDSNSGSSFVEEGVISHKEDSQAVVAQFRTSSLSSTIVANAQFNSNNFDDLPIREGMIDSGASYHMGGDRNIFDNLRKIPNPGIVVGYKDEFVSAPEYMGDVNIVTLNMVNEPVHTILRDVRYEEGMRLVLFSENCITSSGCRLDVEEDFTNVIRKSDGKSIMVGRLRNRAKWVQFMLKKDFDQFSLSKILNSSMFISLATPAMEKTLTRDQELTILYHRRFGHLSAKYLRKLCDVTTGMKSFKICPEILYDCEVCLKAKSTRAPHQKSRDRAVRVLEIIDSDILGPIPPARSGEKYVIVFIDDFSNYSVSYTTRTRDEVVPCFKDFCKIMLARFPDAKIAILRTDNAREYTLGAMRQYCISQGIISDPSNPYTPEQDGRSERKNGVILSRSRCIMLDRDIPREEWPYAIKMAEYILNRSPCRTNPEWQTPYQMFFGKPPDISNIHVPGCAVFVHIDKPKRTHKMDPTGNERVLMGFNSNGYTVMDPRTKDTIPSCNVEFKENKSFLEVLKSLRENSGEVVSDFSSVTDHEYAWVRVAHNQVPLSLSDDIPETFQEAMASPFSEEWREAICKELESIAVNNTWSEVRSFQNGVKPRLISTKWVFTVKYEGEKEFAKARLVARGFQDRNNYNSMETYSPVINGTVFHWVISLANKFFLTICAIDVKTAFLYGDIESDTPIFISVPEGVEVARDVCALQLHKALYGLKISSKKWFIKFTNVLVQMGFINFIADQCVFFKEDGVDIIVFVLYVDDGFMACSNPEKGSQVIQRLSEIFEIKLMTKPKIFLGIQIYNQPDYKILNQSIYIEKLARRFGVDDFRPMDTPMEARLQIARTGTQSEYPGLRALIGGLLFISRNTRPDISFPVNYISRFQSEGTQQIFKYALRILRYLYSTRDYSLIYRSMASEPVIAYVDASFADAKDCKFQSTGGYLIFSYGDLIAWSTKKQNRTAVSTTEAEYIALNDARKEISFVSELHAQICKIREPAIVYEDNSSAIRIAEGTESSSSRFLLTKEHAIREAVLENEIVLRKVSTVDQYADILTKSLDRSNFIRIRNFLLEEFVED